MVVCSLTAHLRSVSTRPLAVLCACGTSAAGLPPRHAAVLFSPAAAAFFCFFFFLLACKAAPPAIRSCPLSFPGLQQR